MSELKMTTASDIKPVTILILGQPECDEGFDHWADAHARVERVSTFEEAVQALQARSFDLVVCRAADFVPLQGIHFSAQAAAIIDSVSHGIGILRDNGELEWTNAQMQSFSEEVRARVRQFCVDTVTLARAEERSESTAIRGRRVSFTTTAGEHFEVTATPVVDARNRITQVAAVVWDATSMERLQDKIDAIDQAGRELLSLDAEQFSRLDPQERLSLFEQKILRCTRELLHFDNFEIRILNRQTNKLELVLCCGLPADGADVELFAGGEGNGICGYVAARGRSYICPDVSRDSRYLHGIENAKSSLTVPLRLHDRIVGVANFESTRLAAFNEDDRQFAEIFARYIALALHILQLLVTERQTTTGQLGRNVMAEITAPLNDILTDVETLVEDYIGHDDLRHRLRMISENADRIRETIKELTATKAAVIGARTLAPQRRDAVLHGRRILLADDEDVIRETVRDVLTGYGCAVSTAGDGAAAIDLLAKQPFDLVLSDIKMPVKSGYEVFAAAKHANPATPVILTTGFGYDPNHSIVRARREGLSAVLFKPFKVDQLLSEIRTALKAPSK